MPRSRISDDVPDVKTLASGLIEKMVEIIPEEHRARKQVLKIKLRIKNKWWL